MTKTFTFISTPGHGYLKVSAKFLLENFPDFIPKISSYSYISKDFKNFFLEEDCDANEFIAFFESQGNKYHTRTEFSDTNFSEDVEKNNSKIREWFKGNSSYTSYLKYAN